MKQSLKIDEFLNLYQTGLALSFVTRRVGLHREISLLRPRPGVRQQRRKLYAKTDEP